MEKTFLIVALVACVVAYPAGAINIFAPEELSSLAFSTHTLSPRLFVDVVCQSIPVDVYFIGIQPGHTTLGESLSGQVDGAVKLLAKMLADTLD